MPKLKKPGWLRSIYNSVASTLGFSTGGYQVLDPRRKILPNNMVLRSASANELASMSLPQLRALCRKLERDNSTARAVVEGLVAQIVGTGITLEPDTGDPKKDARLRAVWQDYIAACDITGKRSIFDLQAQAFREVVVAGEFIWRLFVLPELAAKGQIPLVVLPLECEWISCAPPPVLGNGITAVSGMELDNYGRPIAFNLVNPESSYLDKPERVPQEQIIHGFERRRALQARGEPWLVPVIERIWQEGDLIDAELRSAINCAAMAMVITAESHDPPDTTVNGTDVDPATGIAVGSVARLYPGESIQAFSHNRPSQLIAEFRRTMRGDIGASSRLDQIWLDRDYQRAGSYSSRRAANIDNERLHSPVREWFGHATIGDLWERALPYLSVMAGVSMPKKARAYRLVPDVTPYVDPLKDAQAAILAISAGLSTFEKENGKRGEDGRKLIAQLSEELKDPLLHEIFQANLHPNAQVDGQTLDQQQGQAP